MVVFTVLVAVACLVLDQLPRVSRFSFSERDQRGQKCI